MVMVDADVKGYPGSHSHDTLLKICRETFTKFLWTGRRHETKVMRQDKLMLKTLQVKIITEKPDRLSDKVLSLFISCLSSSLTPWISPPPRPELPPPLPHLLPIIPAIHSILNHNMMGHQLPALQSPTLLRLDINRVNPFAKGIIFQEINCEERRLVLHEREVSSKHTAPNKMLQASNLNAPKSGNSLHLWQETVPIFFLLIANREVKEAGCFVLGDHLGGSWFVFLHPLSGHVVSLPKHRKSKEYERQCPQSSSPSHPIPPA